MSTHAGTAREDDVAHAARGGASQLLAVLGQGMLFVTEPVISRFFGAAAYGVYKVSLSFVEILVRAGMMGADKGMFRFISWHRSKGEPALEEQALGDGLRRTAGITGALAAALAAAAGFVAWAMDLPAVALTLPLMAPAAVPAALTTVLMAATLGAKVTRANLLVRGVVEPALLLGAVTLAGLLGLGLRGLAAAHLVAYASAAVLAAFACTRVFGARRLGAALAGPPHAEFRRFVYPLGGSEIMNVILQRADVILLAALASPSEAGFYAAGETLTRVIGQARSAFDSIVAPMVAEAQAHGDRERLRANLRVVTRWVALAAVPIATTVIALRRDLLAFFGPGYAAAAAALVVLAIGQMVNAVLGLTAYVLTMGGHTRLFLVDNAGSAILNVILCLALIPRFGILGAAVAVTVSVTVLQLALTLEAWRLEGVHPFAPALAKPFVAGALTLAVELAVARVALPLALRLPAVVAAGLVTYLVAVAALGPGAEERQLGRRIVGRLLGRRRA